MLLEIRNTSVLLLVSAANGFLVLRTGAITKWRNTKDWKDTEQYSHHKTKPDYTQTGGGGGGGRGVKGWLLEPGRLVLPSWLFLPVINYLSLIPGFQLTGLAGWSWKLRLINVPRSRKSEPLPSRKLGQPLTIFVCAVCTFPKSVETPVNDDPLIATL